MTKTGELFNWSFTAIKVPAHWVTMVMNIGCEASGESTFWFFESGGAEKWCFL